MSFQMWACPHSPWPRSDTLFEEVEPGDSIASQPRIMSSMESQQPDIAVGNGVESLKVNAQVKAEAEAEIEDADEVAAITVEDGRADAMELNESVAERATERRLGKKRAHNTLENDSDSEDVASDSPPALASIATPAERPPRDRSKRRATKSILNRHLYMPYASAPRQPSPISDSDDMLEVEDAVSMKRRCMAGAPGERSAATIQDANAGDVFAAGPSSVKGQCCIRDGSNEPPLAASPVRSGTSEPLEEEGAKEEDEAGDRSESGKEEGHD
ncbi:hypothetical protein FRB93_004375 [Tulasnella sp. JGI-2019a]|nr:hypothetical protein FRB93_004375 [Tulasnella sp. JGI-2019a]